MHNGVIHKTLYTYYYESKTVKLEQVRVHFLETCLKQSVLGNEAGPISDTFSQGEAGVHVKLV